ncbi:MAG: GAF domain-containing protein [Candidatus Latescibacterota bacterium]|nr:MAG: GAF domain-containing protein [Candidatus Latescibacterota bacterium]
MNWTTTIGCSALGKGSGSVTSGLRLRMMGLFAFFIIVFVAKEIAGFTYKSNLLLLMFLCAAILQSGGHWVWPYLGRWLGWPDKTANSALTCHSSVVDLFATVGIVYLTGMIGSPFLFLLVVPLFFASHAFASRPASTVYLAGMVFTVGLLGYLEMKGVIPHFDCYPFENDVYLNKHFFIGSLLVLGGFLSLILFLSNVFQHRFSDSVNSLAEQDRDSRDKIQELTRLYDISLGVNAVMTVETLLKMVAKEATLLLSKPWAGILLFRSNREITHAVSVGAQETDRGFTVMNRNVGPLTEWIAETNKPVVVRDTLADQRLKGDSMLSDTRIRSLVGLPLSTGQRTIGVIYVGDYVPKSIDKHEVRLLTIMSDQLTIAIAKSTLYETLQRKLQMLEAKLEDLEEVNHLKTEYVSHVSHELRTPLTSIKAYAETLGEHIEDPNFTEKKTFLSIIEKETERLIRIVNDILDISNIEFGQRPLERQVLNIRSVIDEVTSALQPKLDEKNIELQTCLPEDLPRIDVDKDLITQVFINLVTNAIKYSSEGTTITVNAEEEAVSVKISIKDEGIGIPQAQIDKIFDRYYRVKSDKSRRDDGVGLGLAIVKSIIDRHGGMIEVESEENVGSKFIFTLPKEHCVNDLLSYFSQGADGKSGLHETLLNLIVRIIAELLNAKIISLMLLDRSRSELFIKVSYGLDEWVVEQARVKVGEGIAGKVAETGVPLLIDNIEKNGIHSSPNNPQYETASLLSVPLIVSGVVVGVINVNNKMNGEPFDQDDLNLLVSFGERISKALERLRAAEDWSFELQNTVEAVKKMVEQQIETKSIERIVDLAVKTSRKLGLSEKEVKVIQYVASVHDIGMTKVSDEILNKTFHLSREEIKEIQTHPEKGAELIRPLEFVELVSHIILYHHERVDGMGYPMGLKGDHIPLGSRILAVIDAYQSMTTERPYREPSTETDALRELVECAGRQFDAEVVDRFIDVLADEGSISPEQAAGFKGMLSEGVGSETH